MVGLEPLVVPELIEAASKTGDVALLRTALEWLSERTRATPTEWVLGIEARVRALLAEGDVAERLHRESIERLGRTRVRVELARGHLLYGEWLRRERRRVDAREQLRTAHDMLDAMGIEAFAERARRELLATGETARKRTVETRDELTAQEALIARLARDGLSNPEIGTRLFISPRTVKYHLRKVFLKLDISSRGELDRVLPADLDHRRAALAARRTVHWRMRARSARMTLAGVHWSYTPIETRFRTIAGLSIRFAESEDRADHALLLSPWPESLLAFDPTWARLSERTHLVAIDLPGFGGSQRDDALLSPRAMGEFVIRAADTFGLEDPHVIGPDVGTGASLFAAALHPGRCAASSSEAGARRIRFSSAGC